MNLNRSQLNEMMEYGIDIQLSYLTKQFKASNNMLHMVYVSYDPAARKAVSFLTCSKDINATQFKELLDKLGFPQKLVSSMVKHYTQNTGRYCTLCVVCDDSDPMPHPGKEELVIFPLILSIDKGSLCKPMIVNTPYVAKGVTLV